MLDNWSEDWISCLILFAVFVVLLAILRKVIIPRRLEYMPPLSSRGPKGAQRDLAAVEAAVLLERPMDTVVTLILLGVLRKGAACILAPDSLKLQVQQPLPADLYDYEVDFLKTFQYDPAHLADKLKRDMVKLVRRVWERMWGFSRAETIDYYRGVVEEAWWEVQAAAMPEVKSQKFDDRPRLSNGPGYAYKSVRRQLAFRQLSPVLTEHILREVGRDRR